jgi:dTMP kinase
LFITLEGGEGAGKSTQVHNIRDWLEGHGHSVRLTRQPGGTPLAEKIRALLLDAGNEGMHPTAELLMLFADRAEFLHQVVRPALANGETVLCDRFTDSTYAYQGGGRGVATEDIGMLEELVHGDLQPDLTLLLDIEVAQGMARASKRGDADRFEQEDQGFFERVRAAYLARVRRYPARYCVVDASGDPDQVWQAIRQQLELRLGQ